MGSVALQVQILLSLDQLAAAQQAYQAAKVWAEDSLVIQLCEAWIGLRTVCPPFSYNGLYHFKDLVWHRAVQLINPLSTSLMK